MFYDRAVESIRITCGYITKAAEHAELTVGLANRTIIFKQRNGSAVTPEPSRCS